MVPARFRRSTPWAGVGKHDSTRIIAALDGLDGPGRPARADLPGGSAAAGAGRRGPRTLCPFAAPAGERPPILTATFVAAVRTVRTAATNVGMASLAPPG